MLVSTIFGGTHRSPELRPPPSKVTGFIPTQKHSRGHLSGSQILIDQGSSSDIMYNELFSKLRIKPRWLEPYHRGPLIAFNGSTTQPPGCIKLPITFKKEGDHTSTRIIQVRFLVLPCDSNYNCILGRTTLKLLEAVPSTVHVKLRDDGLANNVVAIEADKKALKTLPLEDGKHIFRTHSTRRDIATSAPKNNWLRLQNRWIHLRQARRIRLRNHSRSKLEWGSKDQNLTESSSQYN
jgi:hypothetical protein